MKSTSFCPHPQHNVPAYCRVPASIHIQNTMSQPTAEYQLPSTSTTQCPSLLQNTSFHPHPQHNVPAYCRVPASIHIHNTMSQPMAKYQVEQPTSMGFSDYFSWSLIRCQWKRLRVSPFHCGLKQAD